MERGYEVEFWVSSLEPLNPEGIFIPQLNAGIINGNHSPMDFLNTGAGEIIYMENYLDKETLNENNMEIAALNDLAYKSRQQAYNCLNRLAELKAGLKQPTSQYSDQAGWEEFMQNLEKEILQQPGDNTIWQFSHGRLNYKPTEN